MDWVPTRNAEVPYKYRWTKSTGYKRTSTRGFAGITVKHFERCQ